MSGKNKSAKIIVLLILVALAVIGVLFAQGKIPLGSGSGDDVAKSDDKSSPPVEGDFVVAKFDGGELKKSEIDAELAAALPAGQNFDYESLPPAMQENIIKSLVSKKITLAEAEKANVFASPELEKKIKQARESFAIDFFLREKAKQLVSEDQVKQSYDEKVKNFSGVDQAKASHILVKTKEEADKIYKEIKAGADFAELAKKHSADPASGANGGDLGTFTKDQMVKEFSDAVFALKAGEVSSPVKSDFGWHIIKLAEITKTQAPSFEEVKEALRSELEMKAMGEYYNSGFTRANGQLLNADGTVKSAEPAQQVMPEAGTPESLPQAEPQAQPSDAQSENPSSGDGVKVENAPDATAAPVEPVKQGQ